MWCSTQLFLRRNGAWLLVHGSNQSIDSVWDARCRCGGLSGPWSMGQHGVQVPKLSVNEIECLGLQNGFILNLRDVHGHIFWDECKQRLKKPFQGELGLGIYLVNGATSTPFMDVVNYLGGSVLVESSEELQPSIVLDRELEEWEESLSNSLKGTHWRG